MSSFRIRLGSQNTFKSISEEWFMNFKTADVLGLKIFYREAGDPSKPSIILLHGFPSSSYSFHDLIPRLADRFHVIAPDYPGMGYSEAPAPTVLRPTFDDMVMAVDGFIAQCTPGPVILYMHDIGGSKCHWASASVCSTGWRRRICLVAGEAFSDGWLRPQRQSWLLAASRRPHLRASAILSSVRSTPNLEPEFLRICWSWFRPMGRRFTQRDVRSSTTKHTFRQSRPGKRCDRDMPLASAA